eukprot:TRINITY_DN14939_c0_g1_i2.p1 TRINITY_DN14939_c0_g1~~TRINITY_DN14939_c0_g1_i2.p1  ORF type:complete len:779 (+),score=249.82 TRINITY_DN14939_c0_g1_i2:32-2338(+)
MGFATVTLLVGVAYGGVYDAAEQCANAYLTAHPGLPDQWMHNDLFGGINDNTYVGQIFGTNEMMDVNMMDGPSGLRDILSGQALANRTAWPAAGIHGLAGFPELSYYIGRVGAKDFAAVGAGVQLGPGVCIHRVPINGRNWEYISGEEATLGYLGGHVVRGIQSNNIMATAKHWAMNNQELNRLDNTVVIDEGTMMESYLRAYQSQIDEGTGAVMCSYNKVQVREHNETIAWMCGSKEVSQHLLRDVMGFKGALMTDWTNSITSTTNGVSVQNRDVIEWEMNWGKPLDMKVPNNATLRNQLAKNSLIGMYASGILAGSNCKANTSAPDITHLPQMYQAAMKSENSTLLGAILAAEGTVLLKKSSAIPFTAKTILLAGEAMLSGGGSGDNGAFGYEQKDHQGEGLNTGGLVAQQLMKASLSTGGSTAYWDYEIPASVTPDVVIIFGAQYRSEGYLVNNADGYLNVDRCDSSHARNNVNGATYGDCNYPQTIQQLRAKYPKATIVSYTTVGGAHIAHDYINLVDAAYTSFYPGQHFATALSMMLTGAVSPGGKLSYTMPDVEKGPDGKSYIQSPISRFNPGLVYPGSKVTLQVPAYAWDEAGNKVSSIVQYGHDVSEYVEGQLIGYKYYEKYGMKPLFPFGYGLSHATTAVKATGNTCTSSSVTGGCTVSVDVTISAPAGMIASEVVQIYVGYTSSNTGNDAMRPVRTLRTFRKVWASGSYTLELRPDVFQNTWSPTLQQWVTPCGLDKTPGTFRVLLGNDVIASFACSN